MGAIHSTKIQTGPTGKRGPPQKVDLFFRNFSGWTEPIHWVLDRNFRKFWLNGSRPVCPLLCYCCEAWWLRSRLIQVVYVTSLGCLCPKSASFEISVCMYVCMCALTPTELPFLLANGFKLYQIAGWTRLGLWKLITSNHCCSNWFLIVFFQVLASARWAWKAQILEKYYLYFLASKIFF